MRIHKPRLVTNITEALEEVERTVDWPKKVLYSYQMTLKAVAKGNCNVTIIPLPNITDRGAFAFIKKNPR